MIPTQASAASPLVKAAGDRQEPVIVVGAGPVGCAAALLLADRGIPVTVLERRPQPCPLPRAVHLDDEVVRILGGVGIAREFLDRSRAATGLRLLDADHRVMAELTRELRNPLSGFAAANMFHQPDLERLLLDRIDAHPLITLHRGIEVLSLSGVVDHATVPSAPVHVQTRQVADDQRQMHTSRYVLGCDGANSTVRDLLGVAMEDLRFVERWLVIDVDTDAALDSWGGVEQVCDPARAATFMRVFGNHYRWEFQLHDDEDEADLLHPPAFARLLAPWTGRDDLDGMEIIRSATYTFRARLAHRFRAGQVFLLGDAAHLTPPFIGQGLGAGLRDADNLAWKLADVINGNAHPQLLDTYETERRPHARALIRKAVLVGWAMTGGQDRAAAVRRLALAAAVRSPRICALLAATETPRLKTGALLESRRMGRRASNSRSLQVGRLVPNVDLRTAEHSTVRLDGLLQGLPAVLTSRVPEQPLVELCRRLGFRLIRLRPLRDVATPLAADLGYVDAIVTGPAGRLQALVDGDNTVVLVRPDRVVAALSSRALPLIPWTTTAAVSAATTLGGKR